MDVATVVPAVGLGAVLVTLVGYVLRQITADRSDFRQTLMDERDRTKSEAARADAAEIRAVAAQALVDTELARRRGAEADAALASSKLIAQQSLLAWYAAETDRLRRYLPQPIGPGILPDPPAPPAEESEVS